MSRIRKLRWDAPVAHSGMLRWRILRWDAPVAILGCSGGAFWDAPVAHFEKSWDAPVAPILIPVVKDP